VLENQVCVDGQPACAGGWSDTSNCAEKNPYGESYPTQYIGSKVRSGGVRGSVIANLKFTGYAPHGSATSSVQLADVFDPEGRTHDIVALLLDGSWNVYGRELMKSLAAASPTRVALVSVLGEGNTPGAAATLSDLTAWRKQSALPAAWTVLDPSHSHFPPPIFDGTALPVIVILDARTMEIVSAEIGSPPQPKQALETFRDQVKGRPRSY